MNRYGRKESDEGRPELEERVVFVNRCSKVVKGGRRFSFSAVVVAGDGNGRVGYGFGKANEVAEAIRKGTEAAKKALVPVTMRDRTIPHEVQGEHDGARILLRPASPGTGVIAGGGMRDVLAAAGIRDVLAKSLGSNNRLNVVKATFAALMQLRSEAEIRAERGLPEAAPAGGNGSAGAEAAAVEAGV
ncbi:MAG: 30S ribosomal protein S5 [Lentisphaerae bacterium]|nr:30S ribosomal protein S5 [Lentisphaerota bacterium]